MAFRTWLVTLVTLAAPPVLATTARPVTVEELARTATAIAIVTPLDAEARWEGRRIITHHRMRVDESWAGELTASTELDVLTLGGRVGDLGQHVAGEVQFVPGAPTLVFLVPDRALAGFRVVAMEQGALRLTPSSPMDLTPTVVLPGTRGNEVTASATGDPRGGVTVLLSALRERVARARSTP